MTSPILISIRLALSVSKQTRKHMKDCAVQSISLIFMTERTQVYFPSPPSFLAPNFLGLWFLLVYGSFNGKSTYLIAMVTRLP